MEISNLDDETGGHYHLNEEELDVVREKFLQHDAKEVRNVVIAKGDYAQNDPRVEELRKRIDESLKAMEDESNNSWGLWKEKADMYEQGASDAYEKSYWILKGKQND